MQARRTANSAGIKSGKITFKEEIYVDKEEISLAYGQSEVIEVWTDNEENLITAYYDGNLLKLEWTWTEDGNPAIKSRMSRRRPHASRDRNPSEVRRVPGFV